MAVLELKSDGKNDVAEKMVLHGTYLYVVRPGAEGDRAYEMPKGKTDGGFLDLLFGMKAKDAKQKYTLTLAKEDQWYVYVDVARRTPRTRRSSRGRSWC